MEKESFLSKATFESYRGVTCEVPPSAGETHRRALRGYQVRLSNDGKLWSQPLPFMIHDGLCLVCDDRGTHCDIKVGKYENVLISNKPAQLVTIHCVAVVSFERTITQNLKL